MGGAGAVPDFTPFFQRAKDKKPDVFFVFVPAGDHAIGGGQDLWRARHARRRHQADRPGRHHPGHQAAGDGRRRSRPDHRCTTTTPISTTRRTSDSSRRGRRTTAPNSTPDFMAVGAYDGMAAIVHAVQATKGKMDGDAAVKSLLGLEIQQPAGPDHDRSGNPRHHHERVPVRGRQGQDGKLHQKVIGTDRAREGQVQGAEDRPVRSQVGARRHVASTIADDQGRRSVAERRRPCSRSLASAAISA